MKIENVCKMFVTPKGNRMVLVGLPDGCCALIMLRTAGWMKMDERVEVEMLVLSRATLAGFLELAEFGIGLEEEIKPE